MKKLAIQPDVIVPMPPSKLQRSYQPVVEVASDLSKQLQIPLNSTSLKKTNSTLQMKDIGDFAARVAALEAAFAVDRDLEGRQILLIDDLFQSGATMDVVAQTLKSQGCVKSVYAIALTRTRS